MISSVRDMNFLTLFNCIIVRIQIFLVFLVKFILIGFSRATPEQLNKIKNTLDKLNGNLSALQVSEIIK
jgi:hypothetical protein